MTGVFYNRPAGGRGPKPYASGAGRTQRTTVGNVAYTIKAWDRVICLTAALTAIRVWTLPPASSVPPGYTLTIVDQVGGVDATNFINATAAGSDTIIDATVVSLWRTYGIFDFISDGVSAWTIDQSDLGIFKGPFSADDGYFAGTLDVDGDATFNGNILAADLRDSTTTFYDNADATKKLAFQVSGVATLTTRTATWPDADITVVGEANTATLSNKTLSSPTVTGTMSAAAINTTGNIVCAGRLNQSGAANPFGYTTGAGGTVTQTTSKATAVTLNTPSGRITMNNAALAANATVAFTLNCSTMGSTDNIIVQHRSGGTLGAYRIDAYGMGAGTVTIAVTNLTAGSLSEAIVLNYGILSGSAS
jgi:hypothetical protein